MHRDGHAALFGRRAWICGGDRQIGDPPVVLGLAQSQFPGRGDEEGGGVDAGEAEGESVALVAVGGFDATDQLVRLTRYVELVVRVAEPRLPLVDVLDCYVHHAGVVLKNDKNIFKYMNLFNSNPKEYKLLFMAPKNRKNIWKFLKLPLGGYSSKLVNNNF